MRSSRRGVVIVCARLSSWRGAGKNANRIMLLISRSGPTLVICQSNLDRPPMIVKFELASVDPRR
jgi:hypothetical protein